RQQPIVARIEHVDLAARGDRVMRVLEGQTRLADAARIGVEPRIGHPDLGRGDRMCRRAPKQRQRGDSAKGDRELGERRGHGRFPRQNGVNRLVGAPSAPTLRLSALSPYEITWPLLVALMPVPLWVRPESPSTMMACAPSACSPLPRLLTAVT